MIGLLSYAFESGSSSIGVGQGFLGTVTLLNGLTLALNSRNFRKALISSKSFFCFSAIIYLFHSSTVLRRSVSDLWRSSIRVAIDNLKGFTSGRRSLSVWLTLNGSLCRYLGTFATNFVSSGFWLMALDETATDLWAAGAWTNVSSRRYFV